MIPDQDSLNWSAKRNLWIVPDSPRKFAFSFLVDNVHISCMIMLLLCTGLIGITVYKQIQGQLNSSGGTQLCTMWACYDWKGINSFQKELSSSVISSYNLCFLLTRRRKAKSAQKTPHISVLKCLGVLPRAPWVDASALKAFPGILLFQVTHVKSVSYFRPAQVFDFTLSIPVQSLSYCCDNSLVSSSTAPRGLKRSTVGALNTYSPDLFSLHFCFSLRYYPTKISQYFKPDLSVSFTN